MCAMAILYYSILSLKFGTTSFSSLLTLHLCGPCSLLIQMSCPMTGLSSFICWAISITTTCAYALSFYIIALSRHASSGVRVRAQALTQRPLLCREDARFLWKRIPDAVKQQVSTDTPGLQSTARASCACNHLSTTTLFSTLCCVARTLSWWWPSLCFKPSGTRGTRCARLKTPRW